MVPQVSVVIPAYNQAKYLKDALNSIQNRLKQPITNYTSKSKLLKEYGKQTRLGKWF